MFEDSSWLSNTIDLAERPPQVLNLADIKNKMNLARQIFKK